MAPKIDTRRLKKLPDGSYTMHRAGHVPEGRGLCETCGHQACPIMGQALLHHVRVEVHACPIYVPCFGFSVLNGLDLPYWNTIRIGEAWPKRLRPGQEVCIVDTRNDRVVRTMLVERMEVGSLHEVIRDHAARNHHILATQPDDPIMEMHRVLRGAYGSNFAAPTRRATAIYLEM